MIFRFQGLAAVVITGSSFFTHRFDLFTIPELPSLSALDCSVRVLWSLADRVLNSDLFFESSSFAAGAVLQGVNSGFLGDGCQAVLEALACATATASGQMILTSLFVEDPVISSSSAHGMYRIKLFRMGSPTVITIDAHFPVLSTGMPFLLARSLARHTSS